MSHQTGIKAADSLISFFGKCRSGQIRLLKVSIKDEKLDLDEYKEPKGSWEDDYSHYVLDVLDPDSPSYILFRLDSKNELGFEWLFVFYSPETSHVRYKMLYASTKATLKTEFGSGQIKHELFGTSLDDVSLGAYQKFRIAELAPKPMTFAEEELANIKKTEVHSDVGVDSRHQTMQGLQFPFSDSAIAALFDLREGKVNYVRLSIDLAREEIELDRADSATVIQLPRLVPAECARYHLFRFDHTHQGDYLKSIVFIYSVPSSNCPVKQRMVYSSCKNPVVEVIQERIGVEIAKKIEIDDGRDLTEEFLRAELHPVVILNQRKFDKPKGPANRGNRRLTKPQTTSDGC